MYNELSSFKRWKGDKLYILSVESPTIVTIIQGNKDMDDNFKDETLILKKVPQSFLYPEVKVTSPKSKKNKFRQRKIKSSFNIPIYQYK